MESYCLIFFPDTFFANSLSFGVNFFYRKRVHVLIVFFLSKSKFSLHLAQHLTKGVKSTIMKLKSSLVILLSIVALSSQAQTIKAGFNFANITITNDGDVDKNKMLTSFHVGFTGDIKIAPAIYFQPGILLTGKGSKTSSGNPSGNTYFEATTSPLYVEIPANFVFKSPGKTINIFGGIGPYIAVGIAGKNKTEGKFLNIAFKSEENIKWSDDDPTTLDYEEGSGYGIMRRFDYGVNALAGVEFKQTVISIGYGFGLAKLQSGSNSQADDKNKHRVLSLSVGFKL